jgi:hypothetical protein
MREFLSKGWEDMRSGFFKKIGEHLATTAYFTFATLVGAIITYFTTLPRSIPIVLFILTVGPWLVIGCLYLYLKAGRAPETDLDPQPLPAPPPAPTPAPTPGLSDDALHLLAVAFHSDRTISHIPRPGRDFVQAGNQEMVDHMNPAFALRFVIAFEELRSEGMLDSIDGSVFRLNGKALKIAKNLPKPGHALYPPSHGLTSEAHDLLTAAVDSGKDIQKIRVNGDVIVRAGSRSRTRSSNGTASEDAVHLLHERGLIRLVSDTGSTQIFEATQEGRDLRSAHVPQPPDGLSEKAQELLVKASLAPDQTIHATPTTIASIKPTVKRRFMINNQYLFGNHDIEAAAKVETAMVELESRNFIHHRGEIYPLTPDGIKVADKLRLSKPHGL